MLHLDGNAAAAAAGRCGTCGEVWRRERGAGQRERPSGETGDAETPAFGEAAQSEELFALYLCCRPAVSVACSTAMLVRGSVLTQQLMSTPIMTPYLS